MYSNDDYLLELLAESGNISPDDVGEAQASKGRRTALEYLIETGRVVLSGTSGEIKSNDAVRRSYLGY